MRLGLGLWLPLARKSSGSIPPVPPLEFQSLSMTAGEEGQWVGYSSGAATTPQPAFGSINRQPTTESTLIAFYDDTASGVFLAVFTGDYTARMTGMQASVGGYLMTAYETQMIGRNTWVRFIGPPGNLTVGAVYEVTFSIPSAQTRSIAQPAVVVPAGPATFTATTGWTTTGSVTFDAVAPGRAIVSPATATSTVTRNITLDPAKTYTLQCGISNKVSGRNQIIMMTGGSGAVQSGNAWLAGHRALRYTPTAGITGFRVSALSQGANPDLSIIDAQVVDITDVLARPKGIIIEFGQSNRVGAFGVTGFEAEIDVPDFRALCIPSLNSNPIGNVTDGTGVTYGMTASNGIGVPQTISTPMSHATSVNTSDTAPGTAVIPQLSEARFLCDNWPTKHAALTPTHLLSAGAGTSILNPAHWMRPNGPYWRLMLAQINAAIASVPGSQVVGIVFQQGEADGTNPAWMPEFKGMIADLRTAYGANIPVVVAEIGGLRSDANIAATIAMQKNLDQNSGHADALANCKYVPRPEGDDFALLENEGGSWIHYTGKSAREMGIRIGQALVRLMTA